MHRRRSVNKTRSTPPSYRKQVACHFSTGQGLGGRHNSALSAIANGSYCAVRTAVIDRVGSAATAQNTGTCTGGYTASHHPDAPLSLAVMWTLMVQ